VAALLCASPPAWSKEKKPPQPPASDSAGAAADEGISPSVSFATYKEQVGRVTIVLGTQIASIDPFTPWVPFQIAVGVSGEGPGLLVARSSFALIDSSGTVHAAAPLREVVEHGKISYFKQANRLSPLHDGNTWDRFRRVSAAFYPQTAAPASKERLELAAGTYFEDILYFPRPESGFEGVQTLQFVARGLEAPVRIRFEVPPNRRMKENP
jgi:hypothetical protein